MLVFIKRLIKAPFIIYGDFECKTQSPSADNTDVGSNTKKYQDHVFCSYHYRLICVHKRYSKPYKTYFDEAAINKFDEKKHDKRK